MNDDIQKKVLDEIVRRVMEKDEKKQVRRVTETEEAALITTLAETTSLSRAEIEAIVRQVYKELGARQQQAGIREAIEADKQRLRQWGYYFAGAMVLLFGLWFVAPRIVYIILAGLLGIVFLFAAILVFASMGKK